VSDAEFPPVPLRVLLVDDEALARTRLKTLLGDCRSPGAVVLGQASDAVQAMAQLQHQEFDLLLLDIHMPGVDGLALAQAVRHQPRVPALVFVTAHAEHAVDAFELDAVDYLTKPVRLERLQSALQKVARFLKAQSPPGTVAGGAEVLIIQERNRTERLSIDEVLYFKAELKYVTVRTARRSFILDGSLNELEEKYSARFLRIHRNALVAKWAARALLKHHDAEEGDGWALQLDGVDELLFVSRRQLPALRELLAAS
jgi:two-component system response regulator AlgR